MRLKYTINELQNELNLCQRDVEDFMKYNLLIPDNWFLFDETEKFRVRQERFALTVWDVSEVERFKSLISLFQMRYVPFAERLSANLDLIKSDFKSEFNRLFEKENLILVKLEELRIFIDQKDQYIDLRMFCDITGYKSQYCYNALVIIDSRVPSARLNIPFYRDLIWIKKRKKWQARLLDFKELRRGFKYELYLSEEKRKNKVAEDGKNPD